MSDLSTHEALQELLGAYALDAVDDDERVLVEEHLRTCPRCRDEVQQHQEVAAHLAYGGADAPEGLWARIAAELEPGGPSPDVAALYPFRRPPPRWPPPVLAAAAAVVVVLLGVLGWQVHRQNHEIAGIKAAVGRSGSGLAADAAAAAGDPGARPVHLASPDGSVRVDAVILPDGTGYLLDGQDLPALAATETYQLWGVVGSQRISLGVLGPHPDVVAFHAAASGIGALAITAESGGGVVQPTHQPVAAGVVRD